MCVLNAATTKNIQTWTYQSLELQQTQWSGFKQHIFSFAIQEMTTNTIFELHNQTIDRLMRNFRLSNQLPKWSIVATLKKLHYSFSASKLDRKD